MMYSSLSQSGKKTSSLCKNEYGVCQSIVSKLWTQIVVMGQTICFIEKHFLKSSGQKLLLVKLSCLSQQHYELKSLNTLTSTMFIFAYSSLIDDLQHLSKEYGKWITFAWHFHPKCSGTMSKGEPGLYGSIFNICLICTHFPDAGASHTPCLLPGAPGAAIICCLWCRQTSNVRA